MAASTRIGVSLGVSNCEPRTARGRRTVQVRATENRTPKQTRQYY